VPFMPFNRHCLFLGNSPSVSSESRPKKIKSQFANPWATSFAAIAAWERVRLFLGGVHWEVPDRGFDTFVLKIDGEVPKQEFINTLDGPPDAPDEYRPAVQLGSEADEPGRAEEAAERSSSMATGIRVGKRLVLGARSHGAQCSFRRAVVDLQAAIVIVDQFNVRCNHPATAK